ncbi:MAG: heparinase II/III family protein [Puniceicoccaceae bacterium]
MKPRITELRKSAVLLFTLHLCLFSAKAALEHPRIWVSPDDKEAINEKIHNEAWAGTFFNNLRARADLAVSKHQTDRDAFLKELPLDWYAGQAAHPRFRYITSSESDRYIIMPFLQDAIECGVVYYLTGEERYAQAAADIMGVVVSCLARMERKGSAGNGGLVYTSDHLKEARIFGAQIPVACDFIYTFVQNGAKVHDIVTGGERDFPFADAQTVFKTYADMAIEVGHSGSNWSVLESPSLVGNTLMMDTQEKIDQYLPFYLNKNTTRQDPLSVVAQSYEKPGDIWPESLQYSTGVAELSTYLMGVLDRLYPDLDLAQKYPNVVAANGRMDPLRYPNDDVISFGDGARYYGPDFLAFEKAYYLSSLAGDTESMIRFGSLIKTGIAKGNYNRATLPSRSYGAHPYFTPIRLLWAVPDLLGEATEYPKPRTDELPFAGIFIQRNESSTDPENAGLMLFVGGAGYVHGHASGMNIELYGEGEVLGIDSGPGSYRSDIHENYYRIFAAHNTVISNGASAGSGGWVNLGIETVQLKAMEPMPREDAVSPWHSFSTTTFYDRHNTMAPAEHQRTLALIRTSPTRGYYVDVFRARSDTPGQYHDYVYHNVGESLSFPEGPDPFLFVPTPARFHNSLNLPWQQNRQYRNPGWHFFEEVYTATATAEPVQARFNIFRMPRGPASMDIHMPGGPLQTYSKAMAPSSKNAPTSYAGRDIPTMVVRQDGEAWTNPFACVFESYTNATEGPAIQSVENLNDGGPFKGLVVESMIDGELLRQYIIILDNLDETYSNPGLGITFTGHFGVVTTSENGDLKSLYIGSGSSLQYGDSLLTADPSTKAAFTEQSTGDWLDYGPPLGWLEYSAFPYVYCVNLNSWMYLASKTLTPGASTWTYIFRG